MMIRIIAVVLLSTVFSNAQSQGLLKKIKAKAEQSVENAAGKKIDKKVDNAINKPEATQAEAEVEKTESTPQASAKQSVNSYSKFDFIPGAQLLIADDFSQDEIGGFPDKWNTDGTGEVVTLDGQEGKWLKMSQRSLYLSPNSKTLPESFTVEFDLVLDMHNKGWMFPELRFALFNSGELGTIDNALFKKINSVDASNITIQLGTNKTTGAQFSNYNKEREIFKTPYNRITGIEENYGKCTHISISVHKQRFRVWVNEYKIFDLPKAIGAQFNQFAIGVSSSNYAREDLGFYMTNFKIAGGLPETKSKLLTEGRLSTTAITFENNSATILPTSLGAIKDIADVLRENEGIKISITGHTDDVGSDENNMTLSLKRAAAVKDILVSQFNIPESMITKVEGKGESQPLGDNKTPLGRAANRRVEFVKL